MDKYIQRFPEQLRAGLEIARQSSGFKLPRTPKQIVISGMGGSGIGGLVVRSLVGRQLPVPLAVVHNYTLPGWCNEDTLVICSSYSGNTEETLATFADAQRRSCMTACVTTGGELLSLAERFDAPLIVLPGGMPPRTCLGYSVNALLILLQYAGLLDGSWQEDILSTAAFLEQKKSAIRKKAKEIAPQITQTIPVIYSDAILEPVALRWKQQLNENAKMHCFQHSIPEMNHNELVAYVQQDTRCSAIFLRHGEEHPRVAKRMQLSMELIRPKTSCLFEITAEGNNKMQQLFHLIHTGDWLSYELSLLRGVDAVDISILESLKAALNSE